MCIRDSAMGVDSGKATYYTTFNCSGAYGVAKETYHCADVYKRQV